jgi:hypothetical protein
MYPRVPFFSSPCLRTERLRRSLAGEVRLPAFNPLPWWTETAGAVAVGETEMIADPKRKPHQDEGDGDKRRRQEEALDEALKNTFPASDPVSVEQPTTTGRARRS